MTNDNKDYSPVIIIFGVSGDLSKRKLLPAMYHLLNENYLSSDTKIVGISRKDIDKTGLLSSIEMSVLAAHQDFSEIGLEKLSSSLSTFKLDPNQPEDFKYLKDYLDSLDTETHKRERLIYMSIPSSAFEPVIKGLELSGLNDQRNRLLIEKPFGFDLDSAKSLIDLMRTAYTPEQIYRIDHYLAKETAQNLLTFRTHNPIFVPLWNSQHIRSIRVKAHETIGIENRADFYEQTGALRDFIQSHLMQLLAMVMMDLPINDSIQSLHNSKSRFFEQLLPADEKEALRGQYKGYTEEVNNPESYVETFASVKLKHVSERWQDTDIILETGKALKEKNTEITIEFKTPHEPRRNNLTFLIQPNEGIELDLIVKSPGLDNQMHHANMTFNYESAFGKQIFDAYERVFMDAVKGDQTLFASDQEVIETWRVLDPLLKVWQKDGRGLKHYLPGSDGPEK